LLTDDEPPPPPDELPPPPPPPPPLPLPVAGFFTVSVWPGFNSFVPAITPVTLIPVVTFAFGTVTVTSFAFTFTCVTFPSPDIVVLVAVFFTWICFTSPLVTFTSVFSFNTRLFTLPFISTSVDSFTSIFPNSPSNIVGVFTSTFFTVDF